MASGLCISHLSMIRDLKGDYALFLF